MPHTFYNPKHAIKQLHSKSTKSVEMLDKKIKTNTQLVALCLLLLIIGGSLLFFAVKNIQGASQAKAAQSKSGYDVPNLNSSTSDLQGVSGASGNGSSQPTNSGSTACALGACADQQGSDSTSTNTSGSSPNAIGNLLQGNNSGQ